MSEVDHVLPSAHLRRSDFFRRVAAFFRRAVVTAARRWPERALHPLRRARARQRVLNAPRVRSVLMVCHGNICRSPFAAARLDDLARAARSDIAIRSAGFVGPRRQPPDGALRAAQRRRTDLSGHASALVDRDSVLSADLVCVMDATQASMLRVRFGIGNLIVLGDLDPERIERRAITDPWGRSDDVFDASYDRIDRCVRELSRLLIDRET